MATQDPIPPRDGENGIALIVVLWFSVLLALIATAANRLSRSDIDLAFNSKAGLQAELAADGALHTALYLIQTGESGSWRVDGTPYAWRLGEAEVRVAVSDERLRVDLNTAGQAALLGMLASLDLPLAEASALAGNIVAHRSEARSGFRATVTDERLRQTGFFTFGMAEEVWAVPGFSLELAEQVASVATAYSGLGAPVQLQAGASSGSEAFVPTPPRFPVHETPLPMLPVANTPPRRASLLRIRAEAATPGGGLFAREAVVSLSGQAQGVPFVTRLWRRTEPQLFAAPDAETASLE